MMRGLLRGIMVKYTKEEFDSYRLEMIAELENELEIWRNTKSDYTHKQAFEILKTIENNEFARNLVSMGNPYVLSRKQRLWMHILAARHAPALIPEKPKDELKKRREKKKKEVDYRVKYPFEMVKQCAMDNGYFVKYFIKEGTSYKIYHVSIDEDFNDFVELASSREVIQFMTGNILEGENVKYARKH